MLWPSPPHPPTGAHNPPTTWGAQRTLPSRGEGRRDVLHTPAGDEGPGGRWWLALGLTCWLLATPYAHPQDDVLLLPVVWYVLDEAPYHGVARLIAVALFLAWWLLPMGSVLGLCPPVLRGLGIVPVALMAALLALRGHALQPLPMQGYRRVGGPTIGVLVVPLRLAFLGDSRLCNLAACWL
jgi:hypothetical protein